MLFEKTYTLEVPITADNQYFEVLLDSLPIMTFPSCIYSIEQEKAPLPDRRLRELSTIQEPTFYAVQLLMDNQGRTEADFGFLYDYVNVSDEILGNDAPADMFIATILGQTSLVYESLTGPSKLFQATFNQ